MTFDDIFEAYYAQYRAEADTPESTDDEYPVAMRLANEAINRWQNYDNTLWDELWETAQRDGSADLTLEEGITEYAAPDNFMNPGGNIAIKDSDGTTLYRFQLVEQEDIQFMSDTARYAYFVGSPVDGYTLIINPAPDVTLDGKSIDYLYYKTATRFTTGSDVTEMQDPYFIVHRTLANRFRSSRNPYYSSAKTDAEDSLRTMQLRNNSGTWTNPWDVPDRSGTAFGG